MAAPSPPPLSLLPTYYYYYCHMFIMFSYNEKDTKTVRSVLPQSSGVTEFSGNDHIKIHTPLTIRDVVIS